jgi:hypothetical protein
MRLFGAFTKTERRDDGTLVVSGICSTESRDSDNEKILASAMKAAIPPFFRSGPAVREQHDPQRAVGAGISMAVDGDGKTHFECLVVDPVTIAKITSKPPVLRGFSIAGRVPPNGRDPRDPTIITALTLSEVSLVDRPAQAEAVVTMWKSDNFDKSTPLGPLYGPSASNWAVAEPVREKPEPEDQAGAPASDPARCPECDGVLSCPKCAATGDADKVAKLSGLVDLMKRERDDAFRKIQAVERERDGIAKKLRTVEVERDAANAELTRRPKGSLRAMPVTVEKGADLIGAAPEAEPEDALALIRKSHGRPLPMAGDGGPMPRRR